MLERRTPGVGLPWLNLWVSASGWRELPPLSDMLARRSPSARDFAAAAFTPEPVTRDVSREAWTADSSRARQPGAGVRGAHTASQEGCLRRALRRRCRCAGAIPRQLPLEELLEGARALLADGHLIVRVNHTAAAAAVLRGRHGVACPACCWGTGRGRSRGFHTDLVDLVALLLRGGWRHSTTHLRPLQHPWRQNLPGREQDGRGETRLIKKK